MPTLTLLRMLGSAGAGLGLLWIAISLIRVERAFPPPQPFCYGAFVLALLPSGVTLLCGAVRIAIDQDSQWLTALVIVALASAAGCSWRAAISLHGRVPTLIQTNKDLAQLRQVIGADPEPCEEEEL